MRHFQSRMLCVTQKSFAVWSVNLVVCALQRYLCANVSVSMSQCRLWPFLHMRPSPESKNIFLILKELFFLQMTHIKYSFISDYRLGCFFFFILHFCVDYMAVIQITQANIPSPVFCLPQIFKTSFLGLTDVTPSLLDNGYILHILWYNKPVKGLGWASGAWMRLVPCTSAGALPWLLPFPLEAAGMSACYIRGHSWTEW